ncbi:MAG: hypothetical protein ABJC36_13910 [Gemmatimonadales bacterium]
MRHSALGLALALALGACVCCASLAGAQTGRDADAGVGRDYRLTMPTLRQVLPALFNPETQKACTARSGEPRNPQAMTLAQLTAKIERCAPMRSALARSGASTREAALTLAAMVRAGRRMTEEESAKVSGGTVAPLPDGALKDNVALLRRHEAELKQLTPGAR